MPMKTETEEMAKFHPRPDLQISVYTTEIWSL